jgi:hypothetical protein
MQDNSSLFSSILHTTAISLHGFFSRKVTPKAMVTKKFTVAFGMINVRLFFGMHASRGAL